VDLWALFMHFIRRVSGFRLEILSAIVFLISGRNIRSAAMAFFDFPRAGVVRRQMVSGSVTRSIFPQEQRTRPRARLGGIGTLLALMGVAIGVLTIRFFLVLAHTVLH
jgi:hypothetical protein